jgi:hypothetical protein
MSYSLHIEEETMASEAASLEATFYKKYTEFIVDLQGAFPEVKEALDSAAALPAAVAVKQYATEVVPKHVKFTGALHCPGTILPGVVLTEELWGAVSDKTKRAVYDYISILDLSAMYSSGAAPSKEWAENIMKNWRGRLDTIDFDSMAEKFKTIFGTDGALPKLPEKFLKGKLAKLAEDIVKEFKPEDFGLRPEDLAAVEKDPTRAFEILMQASTSNPEILQKAMMRVGKKLQSKIQSGALKPQDLAHEAEELMKEFQSNPAFVDMMESFRSAFSFENPEAARVAGKDTRLGQTQARLRKKLEARKAAAAAAAAAKK